MFYLVDSENKYVHINQNALDTCCFLGLLNGEPNYFDRNLLKYCIIQVDLNKKIEELISQNYYIFMLGLDTFFELTCAETIDLLKRKYSHILLYCVVQDKNQFINDDFKKRYNKILNFADKVIYLYNGLEDDFITNRTKFLIENSSCLITPDLYDRDVHEFIEYARLKRLHIEYIKL